MLLSDTTISLIYGAFIIRALIFSVPLAWQGYRWYKSNAEGLGCLLQAITNYLLIGILLVVVAIPPFVVYKILDLVPSKKIISIAKEGNDIYTQTHCLYGSNTLDKDGFQVSFSRDTKLAILNYTDQYLKVCQAFEKEDSTLESSLTRVITPLGSFSSPYTLGCVVPEDSLFNCLSNRSLTEKQYHIVW